MKKIIAVFTFFLAVVSGSFAWTNNLGFGGTGFSTKINAASDNKNSDFAIAGGGLNFFYLGFSDGGFTVKTNLNIGVAGAKDSVFGDGQKYGMFRGGSIGLGYTPIRGEKFTLSATAMFGVDGFTFSDDEKNVTIDNKTYSSLTKETNFALFDVGGDVFGSYRLTNHFGLFADVQIRYVIGGASITEHKDGSTSVKKDDSLGWLGTVKVQPTFGLVFNF